MNAPVLLPDRLSDGLVEAARAAVRLPAGTRIVAAMSGGVDSTVTAAVLAKAGYDVVGVTLQLYDHGAAIQKKGACCAGQDIHDARTAAQGGASIPNKPTTTIGAGGTGWVDEDGRTIGKNSEFESLAAGVYAQDLIQLAPHWKVLAGLRYDGMSAQYDTFNASTGAVTDYQQAIYKASNRFGVLFQPSDRHSYHLSYGTSFNTSGDTYSYSAQTVNTPPEKSMNLELGAKIDSADRRMSSRSPVLLLGQSMSGCCILNKPSSFLAPQCGRCCLAAISRSRRASSVALGL